MNPYLLKGIMSGAEKATETLLNISLKKQQLEKDKKSDDINYKIKNLQLQKLESQIDPELFKMQNEELKNEIKAKKAYRDYALSYLGRAESTAKTQSEKLDTYAKGITDEANSQKQERGFELGTMEFDLSAGMEGKFPYKQVNPLKEEKLRLDVSLKKQQLAREEERKEKAILDLEQNKKKDELDYNIKSAELQKLEGEIDPELFKIKNEALKSELQTKKEIQDLTRSLLDLKDLTSMEFDLKAGAKGQFPFKEKKLSYSERYDEDIRKAEAGEVSWDELKTKYPRKREEINEFRLDSLPGLEKSAKFKEGWGLSALKSEHIAKLDNNTRKVIANLEKRAGEEGLKDLLSKRKKYEEKGVDINAVLEYFGRR